MNTRGITRRIKQFPHLPQKGMPVRPSHRRQKIHLYQLLAWNSQSHDFPIILPPPTDAPTEGLGKLASSSPVHLQHLNIISTYHSPKIRPLATLKHNYRVGIHAIPVQGRSYFPLMVVIPPPTNTPLRKINQQTIHSYILLNPQRTPIK